MTQANRPRRIRPSILDRLTRSDSAAASSHRDVWKESVEQLKASVLRDLENLLNSREGGSPAEAPYDEVAQSIYNYGLPDFASMAADSNATETRLVRAIEREVALFEPRLKDVRISLQEAGVGEERRLRFVIEATLLLDPDPEHIEFDTVLEIDSGQFSLTRGP